VGSQVVPVVAPTVNKFFKMPVEVADAVVLMIEVVVTLQWQVASAVMATVAEVDTFKNKVADAVSLVVEWDIMTMLMTMRYLVVLQDVIVMVNAKAVVSVGPTNKAAVTMRPQVKLAADVMVQKVVKVMDKAAVAVAPMTEVAVTTRLHVVLIVELMLDGVVKVNVKATHAVGPLVKKAVWTRSVLLIVFALVLIVFAVLSGATVLMAPPLHSSHLVKKPA